MHCSIVMASTIFFVILQAASSCLNFVVACVKSVDQCWAAMNAWSELQPHNCDIALQTSTNVLLCLMYFRWIHWSIMTFLIIWSSFAFKFFPLFFKLHVRCLYIKQRFCKQCWFCIEHCCFSYRNVKSFFQFSSNGMIVFFNGPEMLKGGIVIYCKNSFSWGENNLIMEPEIHWHSNNLNHANWNLNHVKYSFKLVI